LFVIDQEHTLQAEGCFIFIQITVRVLYLNFLFS